MLNSLMQNPVIWLFLSLCTIGSLIWGFYASWTSKQRKEISYEIETTEVIKAGKCLSDKLDIRFDKNPITDLSVTKFFIWNSGTEILNREDIVASKPLSVKTNRLARILEADVAYSNEETNNFSVATLTHEELTLSFDYIAKRQGIVLQVIHTGSATNLFVDCTIKGGEKVKNPSKEMQLSRYRKILRTLLPAYPDISAYAGVFLAVPLVELVDTLPLTQNDKAALSILTIAGVALISVLLARKLRRNLHNRNPHVVPPSLMKVYTTIPIRRHKSVRKHISVHNQNTKHRE